MSKFKAVTPVNWLEPDLLSTLLVKRNRITGEIVSTDGRDWIEFVAGVTLSPEVPKNVREAFEFAAGAVGYAYFYYPIFTLVSQQILRVADFAAEQIFIVRDIKPQPQSFARRIVRLREISYVDENGYVEWERIRYFRNKATHIADFQHNWGLAMSLNLVRDVAHLISALPWRQDAAQP